MTGPGTNVSQACAACKHQRRKCAPDCPLAPYFPPHRQAEFLNVHKLFGIRNIINAVKTVDPNQREIVVRSMIEEAELRVMDPVGGSCGMVKSLYDKCEQVKVELDMVFQQLAICRAKSKNVEVRRGVRSFYDNLMPRHPGNGALRPPRNNIEISKKTSVKNENDGVEALQIGVNEEKGAKKMRNIDINKESREIEENDLDKEDVKQ
ncbi:hypothetical protein DCAR_0100606 [Daucus carota subsp. sativus]|uniref:LOB domain-containing protein n=1 Tax=Daucus carota subsp. sativus TaxID=79200 RepID=A0A166FSU5_DAUCS|nr:PREDICTED: LOB domain-containing protein 22-like [Daucus carota subsp. sativus]WOG81459.1 hypothetical protein DCAR_0100606 [Daucus carota subsp. sativus]